MIILFDEAEKDFTSLGLGILRDATECTVQEKLNDTFELSMSYPVSGANFSKIRIGRIIFAKPNPYDNQQPFRIYSVSKPLNGIVTVSAQHISYDMNGIPCKAVDATGLNDALSQIQNGTYISHNFTLSTNISSARTFKTTTPYNMRALLMGDDEESLLGVYDGEVKFDKFNAMIYSKRGKDRGAQVSYGYNMTDLTHETNTDLLYNGVFPYYHKETTSEETTTEDTFTQVYIVGTTPFVDGWLSYSKGGEAYHPLDATPVQIASEGDYYQKVYTWDTTYQKYVERIYNETVTLIEGVTSPTWIVIDWSSFPTIACRANAKGYFKLSTDTDWGDEKGVGDVVFQGNILSSGLTEMASNLVLYYSEVIPDGSNSTTKEVSEVTEVILDEPIIKLTTTDAMSMKYDRILNLDLTSEFDEEPTKDALRTKAQEYISEHKVGTVKHNTTVSFVDLATTTEADKYKNFDHIELGDTVRVVYKDLGVDVQLRAITTSYDALSDTYSSVELGEKSDSLSSQSIQNGDSISSLTNDAGYADITTVNKLIAKTVTAEYIQAVNAKLSQAQIEELEVAKINCTGIVEATQFVLDELVAKLLTAENAKISNTLEAGTVKVAGDITVNSGQISINGENGTSFNVDKDGNMTANSVNITGGTFNINDGAFEVTNDGVMTAKAGQIGDCEIDENGSLKVPSANIIGDITATSISITDSYGIVLKADNNDPENTVIGCFTVSSTSLRSGLKSYDDKDNEYGVYIGSDGIKLGQNFYVDSSGNVTAKTLRTVSSTKISYAGTTSNDTYPEEDSDLWVDNYKTAAQNGEYIWTRVGTAYTTSPNSYEYAYSCSVRRAAKTFHAVDNFAKNGSVIFNDTNFSDYGANIILIPNVDTIMDKNGDLYNISAYNEESKVLTYGRFFTSLKGDAGLDGAGIKEIIINDGLITIHTTDGKTPIDGVKIKGEQGVGIKDITISTDGLLTVTKTDNTTPINNVNIKGDKGEQGKQGEQGVGIKDITISTDGLLTVTKTDNTTPINNVNIKGDKGEQGKQGEQGVGIKSIAKTSTANKIDTYTITNTDNTTSTFNVTNGNDGADGTSAYAYNYLIHFDKCTILFKSCNEYSKYQTLLKNLYDAGFSYDNFIDKYIFYAMPVAFLDGMAYRGFTVSRMKNALMIGGIITYTYYLYLVKPNASSSYHTSDYLETNITFETFTALGKNII